MRTDGEFAAIYTRHHARVQAAAQRVLRDPDLAEDIAQEIFLSLWRDPARFDPERGRLDSYLTLRARSRALDAWRARRSSDAAAGRYADEQARRPQAADDAHTECERGELRRQVRAALRTLPTPQREALVLSYWRGLGPSEIARACGIPPPTAKSRVRLGLEKVAARLEPAT